MNKTKEPVPSLPVRSNAELGSAVLVGGCLVAWFADPEQAVEWARENYFGNWLTWRAKYPEIVPLTPEELAVCEQRAAELVAMLRVE